MTNFDVWSTFAAQRGEAAPLSFVYGTHHPVLPEAYCRPHAHRSIEIVYHPSGRGVTRFDSGHFFNFRERGAVIYAPLQMHDQEMFSNGEDRCIHLALPEDAPAPPSGGLHVPRIEDALLIEEIRVLSQRGAPEGVAEQRVFNFRATAILLALTRLACAFNEQKMTSSGERRILQAEQYIRENSPTIKSMREVADHAGIGYDSLRHTFRKSRGKSLVRFFNEVRIERVKTLLAHSEFSLKEIAPACGFSDEYYLSTVFRKLTGTTPGHYRRNHS